MSITANTITVTSLPAEGNEWFVSLTSEDASGVEPVKALESGKIHYLTKLVVRTDSATDLSLGSGETTPGTIDTVHLGTIPLNAASGIYTWIAPRGKGLKFTAELAIAIKASAGTIHVYAEGKTCRTCPI